MKVRIVKTGPHRYIAQKRVLFFFWRRMRKYSWRFGWEVKFDNCSAEYMKSDVKELYPNAKFV